MNHTPQLKCWRTLKRWIASGTLVCTSMIIMAMTTGCSTCCTSYNAVMSPVYQSGCLTDFRGRLEARKIWASSYAKCYRNHCNVKDVRDGFIDGFVDTCNGGDGCPPLFAPEGYCMLSLGCKDRCASAWFEGYPLGVVAAEKCGACRWAKSRCNPALLSCSETLPCNPGCEPCKGLDAHEITGSCGCNSPALIQADQYHVDEYHIESYEPVPMEPIHESPLHQPDEVVVPGPVTEPIPEPVPEPAAPAHVTDLDAASVESTAAESGLVTYAQPVAKPELIESAQVETPSPQDSDRDSAKLTEKQLIELAAPFDWLTIDESEQGINAVNYEIR
ncbi:hypothetical protein CA13_37010 [Planctomycetes bacterium CA13]|uniref:Uncharacterized protein n=1 Tax=Novipirellula herctigrandis TaxID=2527986 RepID=A0A5C5Z4D3_9BACT|nr:hypothetical protein CA13_37010 [Planctomycetes bacterium CA13]